MNKKNKTYLKQTTNAVAKILILILIVMILLTAVGISSLFISLSGTDEIFLWLPWIGGIIFCSYLSMCLFRVKDKTYRNKFFFKGLAFFVLIVIGLNAFMFFKNKIDVVDEKGDNGVDIKQYLPFESGSKVVKLDEKSTLKINDNLPKLDGALALYPVYAAFVQAVYPSQKYVVDDSNNPFGRESSIDMVLEYNDDDPFVCSNTANAYKRLIIGNADMIFAAGPSKEQIEMAKEKGKEFHLTPIGKEAFVFFVNSRNPINNLSIQEVKDIYGGKINNWSTVGGKNRKIRAFQRPTNSGSQTTLLKFMGNSPLIEPEKKDVPAGMGGMISEVASYKNYGNAIGFSFLYYTTEMVNDKKIKILSLNGVEPNKENIRNGKYPLFSNFYIVTTDSKNPNVKKFTEWILSPQGQEIIEKTGYIPLTD